MNYKRIIFASILVIVFFILAFNVDASFVEKVDNKIYNVFSKIIGESTTNVIKVITFIGNNVVVVFVCLALLIPKSTRAKIGIPALSATIVSTILMVIIKNIVARQRPNILPLIIEKSYSFPSGHAMVNTALYFTIAFFVIRTIKNKKVAIPLSIFLYILPIIIGLTRVYLGVHYISDVFAGIFIGCAVYIAVSEFFVTKKTHV